MVRVLVPTGEIVGLMENPISLPIRRHPTLNYVRRS